MNVVGLCLEKVIQQAGTVFMKIRYSFQTVCEFSFYASNKLF